MGCVYSSSPHNPLSLSWSYYCSTRCIVETSDLVNNILIEWSIYIIRVMYVSINIKIGTTSETVVDDEEIQHHNCCFLWID